MGVTNTAGESTPRQRPPRATIASIAAGLIVFVLLFSTGVILSQSVHTQWVARSSALVLPSKPVNPDHLPGYYETLSRGQMVTTLAELVRLGEFQTDVAEQLSLTGPQRESVGLTVNVISDTAMLQVAATSEDLNLTVAMVDGVVMAATDYVGDLGLPYALVPVSAGVNNVTETGMSAPLVIGVFSLVALVAAVAVQQAIYRLIRLTDQRHTARASTSGTDAIDHEDPTTPEPPLDDANSVAEAQSIAEG